MSLVKKADLSICTNYVLTTWEMNINFDNSSIKLNFPSHLLFLINQRDLSPMGSGQVSLVTIVLSIKSKFIQCNVTYAVFRPFKVMFWKATAKVDVLWVFKCDHSILILECALKSFCISLSSTQYGNTVKVVQARSRYFCREFKYLLIAQQVPIHGMNNFIL